LARTRSGKILLVEAKAHIPELASPPTGAVGESLDKIEAAFDEVRGAIAPRSSRTWSGMFYQYANRLAMLYLLRTVNNVDAHLLHVLFLNAGDMDGPRDAAEWRGALTLLRASLGLGDHRLKPYSHDLFIDTAEIAGGRARTTTQQFGSDGSKFINA
jgi:hypothetical protein